MQSMRVQRIVFATTLNGTILHQIMLRPPIELVHNMCRLLVDERIKFCCTNIFIVLIKGNSCRARSNPASYEHTKDLLIDLLILQYI